jgi:hypothetical protein
MSKLLRLPFALLSVLALFLLSPGIAAADTGPSPEDCQAAPATEGCDTTAGDVTGGTVTETPTDTVEPKDDATPLPPAGNDDSAEQATGVMDDVAAGVAANQQEAAAQGTDGDTTGIEEDAETPPQDTPADESPDPAEVGTCVAGVLQGLLTELQAQFGDGVDGLITEIQDGLTGISPTDLTAFLQGLPAMGQDAVEGMTEEGQALLAGAAEDIQNCIPAAPSGETPPPSNPPVQQPVTQPVSDDTYYANCDDARAQGAAPIDAGQPGYRSELDSDSDGVACEVKTHHAVATTQPTRTLAYTGADVDGLIRLGLILLSGGTLVLLAGVRRA